MVRYKKHFWVALSILIFLIAILIVVSCLKYNSTIAEYWSRTVARYYQVAIGTLTSALPFSIFEIVIYLLVIGIIVWLVFLIRHLYKVGLRFSSKFWLIPAYFVTITSLLYAMTAGMEYNRYPLDIPSYEGTVSENEYMDIANYFLDEYNKAAEQLTFDEDSGALIAPYSLDELNAVLKEEYAKLDSDYFSEFTPNTKKFFLLQYLYVELGITGVSFAPLSEANLNYQMTSSELPFVATHEIAHIKGVMREEDANLLAFYVLLNSDDPFLKYSAFMWTFSSLNIFPLAYGGYECYQEFVANLNPKIIKDNTYRYYFWESHNLFERVGNFFNNLYLYVFGNDGTSSYQDNIDISASENPDGTISYTIDSFSRYQKMYLYFYYLNQ